MKVILIEDVKSLGSMSDIVNVKDGYARNFLFPKKLARPATSLNLKVVDEIKKKKSQNLEKEKKALEALKEKLASVSCTITVEAGDNDDKLFGSVMPQDIADALQAEGFSLDKKNITIEEPIKKLGVYHVSVKLHPEVKADVKIWVVKR